MPEHHDPAQPGEAAAHGCTCGAHTITRTCPVDCLSAILSGKAFYPLARAYGARFDLPGTVGDDVDLYLQRRLSEISGLGPRRIGEIEVSLTFAGLIGADSHARRHEPAPGTPGGSLPAVEAGAR